MMRKSFDTTVTGKNGHTFTTLYTVNIDEEFEDPEWAGSYNDRITPTNTVFASYEDAMNKAHELALQRCTDIEAPEETIKTEENWYAVPAPWDTQEEARFIVCELIWED